MKPRNKFEQNGTCTEQELRPITKAQMNWAFRECIDHYAHRLPKGRTTCMDCGHSWIMDKQTKYYTWPRMWGKAGSGNKLCPQVQQKQYFTVLTTCGGIPSAAYVPPFSWRWRKVARLPPMYLKSVSTGGTRKDARRLSANSGFGAGILTFLFCLSYGYPAGQHRLRPHRPFSDIP